MKLNVFALFLSLTMVGIWLPSETASAQDKGLSPNELLDPNHADLNSLEDKPANIDGDFKAKVTLADSSAMTHSKPIQIATPITKPKGVESKPVDAKDEEDPMSFNFLYYIIQKFKISDLVDE